MKELTFEELFNHPIVNIDKQTRFSSIRMIKSENVAEHSSITSNICILIGSYLNYLENKKVIDIKEIAYRSVIHDYAEAYYCDIATDVKYCDERLKPLLDEIELRLLMQSMGELNGLVEDVMNSKDDGSIEGLLVTCGDRLNASFTLIKEFQLQNSRAIKKSLLFCLTHTIKSLVNFHDNLDETYEESKKFIDRFIEQLSQFKDKIEETKCYV